MQSVQSPWLVLPLPWRPLEAVTPMGRSHQAQMTLGGRAKCPVAVVAVGMSIPPGRVRLASAA